MTEPNKPTLRHVALAAGVAPSTASMALRGRGRMAPQTRARVREAARRLGYQADAAARVLRTGSSPLVAVHVHPGSYDTYQDVPRLFYSLWLLRFMEVLTRSDIAVTIVSDEEPELVSRIPVSALVAIPSNSSSHELVRPPGVPTMVAGWDGHMPGFPTIYHDFPGLTREVMEHLRERGAERPAMIAARILSRPFESARETYLAWCQEHGLEPLFAEISAEGGQEQAMQDVLALGADAIYSFPGDSVVALKTLHRLSKASPKDVLLVCQSEGAVAPFLQPSVTTLSLQGRQSGELVALEVIRLIESGEERDVECPYTLTIRGSTQAGIG